MSPQHLDALQIANQRRFARSAARGRITAAGGIGHQRRATGMKALAMRAAADELEPRPDYLKTMAVAAFLKWSCPAIEVRRIMHRADIHDELRPLGDITDRQVQVVCDELRMGPAALRGVA